MTTNDVGLVAWPHFGRNPRYFLFQNFNLQDVNPSSSLCIAVIVCTRTCRFDHYNFSPQKLRLNGPIFLKLLKFQNFRQNTGIYIFIRYNVGRS